MEALLSCLLALFLSCAISAASFSTYGFWEPENYRETGKFILSAEKFTPGWKKLAEDFFPIKPTVFTPFGRLLVCLKKSLPASFFMPGIILPAYRNISSHICSIVVCFSLVWSIKVHIGDKIDPFLNFELFNFLVRTLQYTEALILYLFFQSTMTVQLAQRQ